MQPPPRRPDRLSHLDTCDWEQDVGGVQPMACAGISLVRPVNSEKPKPANGIGHKLQPEP